MVARKLKLKDVLWVLSSETDWSEKLIMKVINDSMRPTVGNESWERRFCAVVHKSGDDYLQHLPSRKSLRQQALDARGKGKGKAVASKGSKVKVRGSKLAAVLGQKG